MSRTLIGKVEVDPTDGKIYLNGKASNRTEVDLRIMEAQIPAKTSRLQKQLAKLNKS
jgi:hypothetical protein